MKIYYNSSRYLHVPFLSFFLLSPKSSIAREADWDIIPGPFIFDADNHRH